MKKRWMKVVSALVAAGMLTGCAAGTNTTPTTPEQTKDETQVQTDAGEKETDKEDETQAPVVDEESPEIGTTDEDGYTLIWKDDFSGDSLNADDWNYEFHEAGWVNNELQSYDDSAENTYVKDGHLVIQALKKDDGTYTSGRINTQNKHDLKYGKVEVKAKMPIGAGFLPAIWMMPTDESLYGQWPKCGEIDIAEVLGDKTNTLYSTLHFGYPHNQGQGTHALTLQRYSDDYHVYGMEWEPGEIRFYVDGMMYHKENDWFTKRDGFGEVTYPAPFDQPFYLILNLAVGGDWPGNPTEKTTFDEKAQLCVDYVRMYQKDSYDEDVKKPVKVLDFREPDETGNYVLNPDFQDEDDDLGSEPGWYFYLAKGGKGTTSIVDGGLKIDMTEEGTEDYSVQLYQAKVPMIRGHKYRLSFDMKADEPRTCVTAITAPTAGWARYLSDTSFDVSTDWENYTFDFTMQLEDDDNGRVEFNMGKQKSTAAIYLKNVRVEFLGEEAMEVDKNCLPDGNFVYNGEFQEGEGRLENWTVTAPEDVKAYVTNENNIREFTVEVPDSVTDATAVQLLQENLSLYEGKKYNFTFDACGDKGQTITATIAGQTFEATLSDKMSTQEFQFEVPGDGILATEIVFNLGTPGTVKLDNVKVAEDAILINGDFLGQMTGFEVYAYTPTDVYTIVDTLNEKYACCIEISDTGDQDWKIQLKQNNITLEKGKSYRLAFDAKCTMDREIMCALQRDGSSDDDWTPYSGTTHMNLTSDYQTYETLFTMEHDTDPATILSISMGSVGGTRITDKHTVTIDNIVIEEIDASLVPAKDAN